MTMRNQMTKVPLWMVVLQMLLLLVSFPSLVASQNDTVSNSSSTTAPDGSDQDGDIRGGSPSPALPYYGVFNDFGSVCGSGLVWGDIAITAAHCVSSSFPPTLRFNSQQRTSGGTTVSVSSRTNHPDWTGDITSADIAILKLANFLSLSTLTINSDSGSPGTAGQLMAAAGFGLTSASSGVSSTLQATTIPLLTDCSSRVGGFVDSRMVCGDSTSTATCGGDSGSPIQLDGTTTVIGVNSWSNGNCDSQSLDIYTRVSYYKSWIDNEICSQSSAPPTSCPTTPTAPTAPEPTPATPTVPTAPAPSASSCFFASTTDAIPGRLRGTISRMFESSSNTFSRMFGW